MQQLSGLDASFLNLESAAAPLHVASVVLVDPASAPHGFGFEQVRALVASRLHLVAPFRWRLRPVPLGLDHPYWVDDPDFDLEYHLRHIAVPPPGDEQALSEVVARIHARPLDRSRPLWELYVIEGLASGEVAIYTKMHHAAIDGVSGTELLTVLLDTEPTPPPGAAGDGSPRPGEERTQHDADQGQSRGDGEPSDAEMLLRSVRGAAKQPLRVARAGVRAAEALPLLGRFAQQVVPPALRPATSEGERGLGKPRLQAPPTPFNAPITAHRRWAFGRTSLQAIKDVKNAYEVTVNDVIMAVVAGVLRRWLLRHDALPDAPLQAMVPVSVRTEGKRGTMGNEVTALIGALPTDIPDPAARVRRAAASMRVAKSGNGVPATLLRDFTQFATPAVAARAARTVARLRWADRMRIPFNVVVSNVPGPPTPLYFGGALMTAMYPVSAIYDGLSLNITLFSYRDDLLFGVVGCREIVPDLWTMVDDLHATVDETLATLAR